MLGIDDYKGGLFKGEIEVLPGEVDKLAGVVKSVLSVRRIRACYVPRVCQNRSRKKQRL